MAKLKTRKKQRLRRRGGSAPRGDGRSYLRDPMTAQQLRKETQAQTRLKYRPLERTIGGEIRASGRREKEAAGWWDQYLTTVNAGREDTQAAYDQAGAASATQMAQAGAIDQANTQALNADEAASAELRGAMTSPAGGQREAAAGAQRNMMAAAQAGTTATLGANARGYLNDQARIGAGQKIASIKEEQRRGRSLRQERKGLRRERGDFATAKRGELREGERNYQIKRGAFGLEKKELAQKKREAAAALRQKERENAQDNANRDRELDIEEDRVGNEGKSGGRTPSEQYDIQDERQEAYTAATSFYQAAGEPRYSQQQWNALIQRVAMEEGIGYAAAKRAVNRLRKELNQKYKRAAQDPSPNGPGR